VTEEDIAAWLEHYPYRSAARRSYFEGLRSLFAWCLRHGEVLVDPTVGIKVAYPAQKVPRALTEEQYAAVLTAARNHSPLRGYTVVLLYYSAGRIMEVLSLHWEDLSDEGIVFRKTKNGNERLIPWSPGLRRATDGLHSYFGEKELVLPRSAQTVAAWLQRAGQDAGVPHVHPHLFRSTAATRMLAHGARPHAVMDGLGHSKLTTTQRYWAIEGQDVSDAFNLLERTEEAPTTWTLPRPRLFGVIPASGTAQTSLPPADLPLMYGTG